MNKRRKLLIFAYYSIKDPVFQSAVLPYFLNFPEKENYKFFLLTYEQKKYLPSKSEREGIIQNLKEENIHWKYVNWHSGFLKSIKKIYDLITGIVLSIILIKRNKIQFIYSEGFPGCIIAHYISMISRIPHIIHTFEPHADYMLEGGVWKKSSWEYKLIKQMEWEIACKAKFIMTATNIMKDIIHSRCENTKAFRVPSCVNFDLFQYSEIDRTKIRKKYAISDTDILICYLGKFGGMYWEKELFEFFHLCNTTHNNFKFIIISKDNHAKIKENLKDYKVQNKTVLLNLERDEISAYLSASDFGISAIRQIESQRLSSPIKNGEYWACGLPIIIPKGISDDYLFAESQKIGIVLDDLSKENMLQVISKIIEWHKSVDKNDIRNRCRQFVREDRDVKKYQRLYHSIFQNTI
jgi:hypothetical protein